LGQAFQGVKISQELLDARSLLKYLHRYFPFGQRGEIGGQTVDLKDHFIDKFGVKVVNEGAFFLFNYSDREAVWSFPLTRECRV